MEKKLGELRREIDSIDEEILNLILKRMHCVEKVGELKGKKSLKIYVPERENSIFQRLYNQGVVKEGEERIGRREIESIFTEIISFCRSKERKVRVLIEDNNCFFIAGKIFGSCIEIESIDSYSQEENYDFKILKFTKERYEEIFFQEIFRYITMVLSFSGERYIILGKAENGRGAENFTGVFVKKIESSEIEFLELEGFSEDNQVEEKIVQLKNKNIEVKILGSYEKRGVEN